MYRWAFDLGEASIGWAVFHIDVNNREPVTLADGGVRLFSNSRNPSNNQPRNVARREARGRRRNAERRLIRMRSVEAWLVQKGLLTGFDHDIRAIDPYQARAEAADPSTAVAPESLARAMLHLAQSRGFKSNRKDRKPESKSTKKDEKDTKTLLRNIELLAANLGEKTLGQWLHDRQLGEKAQAAAAKDQPGQFHHQRGLRFRGDDPIYPSRAMIDREFNQIRTAQAPHFDLSESDWDDLWQRIFRQKMPTPPERGRCTLYPDEFRALKHLPSSQAFRIEQQLCNLKYRLPDLTEHALSPDQRDAVRDLLHTQKTITFQKLLKSKDPKTKKPLFPNAIGFNQETEKNKKLDGASTWIELIDKACSRWVEKQNIDDLDSIAAALIDLDDPDQLAQTLTDMGIVGPLQKQLCQVNLPRGTMNLSSRAMIPLTDWMKAGLGYADAVKELRDDQGNPLHHSHLNTERAKPGALLPYYGAVLRSAVVGADPRVDPLKNPERHFGKISNPTVHVALNELRKVVNALIKRYGHPAQVHIELGRDIGLGTKARDDLEKQQKNNQLRNKDYDAFARDCGVQHPNGNDRLKISLWKMKGVDRRCVFTGKQIADHQLFNGETEIEHILPYRRTADDRRSNKVVVFKYANALKGNRTPYEAFSGDQYAEQGIKWAEILKRAAALPGAWTWRFGPQAMDRFRESDANAFLARSLNDTRYLSRMAKQYLEYIAKDPVVVVTGKHTANLRYDWDLNRLLPPVDKNKAVGTTKEQSEQTQAPTETQKNHARNHKNRNDHRHHLIDAFVIGLTSRQTLAAMVKDSKRSESSGRLKRGYAPLDPNLRRELADLLARVIISVKPNKSADGEIYNKMAYGHSTTSAGLDPDRHLVTRVNVSNIRANPEDVLGVSKVKGICDPAITKALKQHLADEKAKGTPEKMALNSFMKGPLVEIIEARQIKRLRVKILNQSADVIGSAPFKSYAKGAYAFADIWHLPANRRQKNDKYQAFYVDLATAKRHLEQKTPLPHDLRPDHPAAKRKWRLFKNDVIEIDTDHGRELFRVYGFSATDNRLDARPLKLAGGSKNRVPVNKLGEWNLTIVPIQPDGHIRGTNR